MNSIEQNQIDIMFLTWGENIIESGLFEGQVVNQLTTIASKADLIIHLYSGIPLISRKTLFKWNKSIEFLDNITEKTRTNKIIFVRKWIPVLSTWFYSKWFQLPLYFIFHVLELRRYLKKHNISVIHCRSYPAALMAKLASRKRDVKIIFDTRGAFPEEAAYQNFFKADSSHFKVWKRLEKWLIVSTDVTLNVSYEQTKRMIREHDLPEKEQDKIRVIRTACHKFINPKVDRTGLVYVGVLGHNTWYSLERLAKTYLDFRDYFPNEKLLIVSLSSHTEIFENLEKHGVRKECIELVSANSKEELLDRIKYSRYAIIPVRKPKSATENKLVSILCGAKTADYVSCSIPLITFNEAVEVCEMIKKYEIGQVYSSENSRVDWSFGLYSERVNKNFKECYDAEFSERNQILKYIELYS
jgi:glycosyl transferase family 4